MTNIWKSDQTPHLKVKSFRCTCLNGVLSEWVQATPKIDIYIYIEPSRFKVLHSWHTPFYKINKKLDIWLYVLNPNKEPATVVDSCFFNHRSIGPYCTYEWEPTGEAMAKVVWYPWFTPWIPLPLGFTKFWGCCFIWIPPEVELTCWKILEKTMGFSGFPVKNQQIPRFFLWKNQASKFGREPATVYWEHIFWAAHVDRVIGLPNHFPYEGV